MIFNNQTYEYSNLLLWCWRTERWKQWKWKMLIPTTTSILAIIELCWFGTDKEYSYICTTQELHWILLLLIQSCSLLYKSHNLTLVFGALSSPQLQLQLQWHAGDVSWGKDWLKPFTCLLFLLHNSRINDNVLFRVMTSTHVRDGLKVIDFLFSHQQ